MRSNSDSGTWSMLVGPRGTRGPIQHRVDVLVAIGSAEAFRQSHRFVDGNAKRYVQAMTQLVDADQQDGVLYRIEQRRAAVEPRRQVRIQRLARSPDALDQFPEVLAVGPKHVLGIAEL